MPRILLTPLAQRLLQLAVIIDNADNPGVVRTMIHRFNEVLIEIRKSQPRSSHHPSSFVIETEQYERIRDLIGATWLKEHLASYTLRALGPVTPGASGVLEYFGKLSATTSNIPWDRGLYLEPGERTSDSPEERCVVRRVPEPRILCWFF